ncbi:MAG: hypothetical protein IJU60_07440 [Acholeplasmatales bacterium]|nr:hypothetical protein [Acholeplasmatales bacterium]
MEENTIFTDYEAWKRENNELITTLVKKQSKTIQRFSPVLAVVDYLYEQNQKGTLSEDEELIFSTGFDYIYDQFQIIQSLLEDNFNNDYDEMEKYGQTINLLLYINDFEAELKVNDNLKKDINKLTDLEDKVNSYLDKKENAPDEYFALLDDITYSIFTKNNIEIHTVDQIFYEIAIEYDIYTDEEYSTIDPINLKQV